MAPKKLQQIITPFFQHLLSLSEQLLYSFSSETGPWHQEGAGVGTPDATTEKEQQEQQQKAPSD